MRGADGCAAMRTDLTPLNCTLENGYGGQFILCAFYHFFFPWEKTIKTMIKKK